MKQFPCNTCGELVGDGLGIVTWKVYDDKDTPKNPIVTHKNGVKQGCDKSSIMNYSYEINDFLKDFPTIKL